MRHKFPHEWRPGALDVVKPGAVCAGRPKYPFAKIQCVLHRHTMRPAALIGQLAAEREVGRFLWHVVVRKIIGRHAAEPTGGSLRPPVQGAAVGSEIAEPPRPAILP